MQENPGHNFHAHPDLVSLWRQFLMFQPAAMKLAIFPVILGPFLVP
jgi:hypothetical protein